MGKYAINQWYVAAWARDVGRALLARTICEEPVVLYRREDGSVVALEDVCPHRLLPLSMGVIEGDALRCGYHGLLLDSAGQCLEMPGAAPKNSAVCVTAYPVVERYNFVWVWIGDPARADLDLLPNLWMTEAEGWRADGGTYDVACDYRLIIDNLMDLTHEAHVHSSTLGQVELHDFPITTNVESDKVVTSKWIASVPAPPLYKSMLDGYDGPVDRWQIIEFYPPTGVIIEGGVAKSERALTIDRREGADILTYVLDFITPATEKTCTYFWGSVRNRDVDDDAAFGRITKLQGEVFMEDVAVLEAQQKQIDRFPERKLQAYSIDAGVVRARRALDRLVSASRA